MLDVESTTAPALQPGIEVSHPPIGVSSTPVAANSGLRLVAAIESALA